MDDTLEARLSRGRLPVAAAVDAALALARELVDAHARGVVHGDLSPEHIRFGGDGAATVADLPRTRRITQELSPAGNPTLAALEDLAQNRSHVRKADVLMGALAYKSPEQVRGDVNDATDDIFALGAILYEMLSGQRAFPGTSRSELTREIVLAKPKALGPEVPVPVARVVEKALAAKRYDRYQSAAAVVADLEKAKPSQLRSRRQLSVQRCRHRCQSR